MARILRLSRVGHQRWLLLPPSTGYARRARPGTRPRRRPVGVLTGPSADSTFMSPTVASCSCGHGVPSDLGWSGGCRVSGSAGGAQAPVDDLGLVDDEAVVVGRGQARHLADRAVDVDDGAAGAADEVVVVVADAGLVAGDRAGRLDPAGEPGRRSACAASRRRPGATPPGGHGVRRRSPSRCRRAAELDRGVSTAEPRARHAQPGTAQQLRDVGAWGTARSWPVFLNESRNRRR